MLYTDCVDPHHCLSLPSPALTPHTLTFLLQCLDLWPSSTVSRTTLAMEKTEWRWRHSSFSAVMQIPGGHSC